MSELHFDTATTDITAHAGYVNPVSVNGYLFTWEAYTGTGGFFNGGYLVPYDRELFYSKRRQLAAYRNYTRPIVDSVVGPVFTSPIVRKSNNDLFDAFLLNTDNKGTFITKNSHDVALLARLHGVVFVVMDNFENIPEMTVAEAINTRMYPYTYIQPAYTVKAYKADRFNKLEELTFTSHNETLEDGKTYQTTITWDSINSTKTWYKDNKYVKHVTKTHGLGVLPVIAVYADNNNEVLPQAPFYDLAKLNASLFNKDSELRDTERSQAFSIFYMQVDTASQSIALGPHSAVILPMDPNLTITPGYASPNPEILKILIASSDKYVESMYQLASNNGIVGFKSASSGIAEAYRFVAKNDQLKHTADIATKYEQALSHMFGLYINTPIEYTVNYTNNFDTFYSQSSVDDITKLLNIDMPDKIKKEIKKSVVSRFLDNLSYEQIKELHDIIDNDTVNSSGTI
jgi:hypothetical protein